MKNKVKTNEVKTNEEFVNNSYQPQNGESRIMGIPSKPNKHLKTLLKGLYDEFGESDVNKQIEIDGLPIFLQRVLLGRMSSGVLLSHIVKRYGFDDVQNDLEWLKDSLKESSDVPKLSDSEILELEYEHSQNSSEIEELEREMESGKFDCDMEYQLETLKERNEQISVTIYGTN